MHIDDPTSSDGRMDDRAGPAADDGVARSRPGDDGDLDAVVARGVASFLCLDDVVRDDDGDVHILVDGTRLIVRTLAGPSPAVRVFAPVVRSAAATYDVLRAVNHVNTRLQYARLLWVAGEVIVAAEVPAAHATDAYVSLMCAEVAALASSLADELGELLALDPADRGAGALVH